MTRFDGDRGPTDRDEDRDEERDDSDDRDDRHDSDSDDGALDRFAAALRSARPTSPRADLRDSLLAHFSTERPSLGLRDRDARRTRLRLTPRIAAAAAVLVAAVVLLGHRDGANDRGHDGASIEVQLAALRTRLEHIEQRLAADSRSHASAAPTVLLAGGALAASVQPAFDASGGDPGFLRLVVAGRIESADPRAAIDRYRELVRDYAASPAATVAAARIERLQRAAP